MPTTLPRLCLTSPRALLLALLLLAGCSHVSPYQREYLAHRCMDEHAADARRSQFYHHVYDAREGGMTMSENGGGGCGCN